MVQHIPPPDPRSLLSPLLACLPTAFASPRPPPALLELLSPILRQRVQLLATTPSPSSLESWLPLLCWDADEAKELVDTVSESDAFELHPISGEIEIGSIDMLRYRRLDEETLQARIAAPETGLVVIVLWCQADQEEIAWKVAEVRPLHGAEDLRSGNWSLSMAKAEGESRQRAFEEAVGDDEQPQHSPAQNGSTDDSDYWAQYDRTPGQTPGVGVASHLEHNTDRNQHTRTASEDDYFQRYEQVQPEMDNDDPSEDKEAIGESTLNGSVVIGSRNGVMQSQGLDSLSRVASGGEHQRILDHSTADEPISGLARVSRLERQADSTSLSSPGVTNHVSTSIKSLFRLCRANGLERAEFVDLVSTELQTLSMLDDDET